MHSCSLESACNVVCPDYTTKAAVVLQTDGSPQTASISEKITPKTASTYVFFKSVPECHFEGETYLHWKKSKDQ